jgi:hypothetical protein
MVVNFRALQCVNAWMGSYQKFQQTGPWQYGQVAVLEVLNNIYLVLFIN